MSLTLEGDAGKKYQIIGYAYDAKDESGKVPGNLPFVKGDVKEFTPVPKDESGMDSAFQVSATCTAVAAAILSSVF